MNRFFLTALIVFCTALAMLGCKEEEDGSAVPGSAENYFPLAKGNKWVWVGGFPPAAQDTLRWEVTGKTVRRSGKMAWNIRTERYWEEKGSNIVDSANIEVEPNLILLYMNIADQDADTVMSYPLTEGKEWGVAFIQKKDVIRTSKVVGKEDIVTPYGPFQGALRINSQDFKPEVDSLVMEMSDWYYPGIGKVMTRVKARGQVWEMKLLTAELH